VHVSCFFSIIYIRAGLLPPFRSRCGPRGLSRHMRARKRAATSKLAAIRAGEWHLAPVGMM